MNNLIGLDDIREDLKGLAGFSLTEGSFYFEDEAPTPVTMIYMYCTNANETRLYFMQYLPTASQLPMVMGVVHITDAKLNNSAARISVGSIHIPELVMMLEDKFGVMFPHD